MMNPDSDAPTKPAWLRNQEAILEESAANLRKMWSLPSLWMQRQQITKGATPSEVVYEEDRVRLLHYYPLNGAATHTTPLLFVYALVNRPYILDILPNKSVVEHFVKAGFDTYLIDWGKPTYAERHLDLNTHVTTYLRHIVEHLLERTDSPQVNILGYCMGGTMSAMFTALYPDWVKNLILMAAGIDFSTRDGLLNLWNDVQHFDVDAFIDAYGNCPGEYLQACFLLLRPVQNSIGKTVSFMERLDDKVFVKEFLTMETWLNDGVAVPGELFRTFVKCLYQQNLLVQNRMPVGKRIVNLKNITCPVLNLMAEYDDLVPPAQSEPFCNLVGSKDRQTIVSRSGHIGLAMGTAAQREVWPRAVAWLTERS
jgi:polyhydroxyalkanoate synthase